VGLLSGLLQPFFSRLDPAAEFVKLVVLDVLVEDVLGGQPAATKYVFVPVLGASNEAGVLG